MLFNNEIHVKEIAYKLSAISNTIKLENSIGYFDSNRSAQQFFADLFNIIFDADYKELDKLSGTTNYPAIDLGDLTNKKAIQVTTDNTSTKIKYTIEKFISNELYNDFDELRIYIIGEKKSYTTTFNTDEKFVFDRKKHICCETDLMNVIHKITDIEKLKKIKYHIQNTIDLGMPDVLCEQDIKDCILALEKQFSSTSNIRDVFAGRDPEFMQKKNKVNNMSEQFFEDNVRASLIYDKKIHEFLKNPINRELQKVFLQTCEAIQEYYESEDNNFKNIEALFRSVFTLTASYENDRMGPKLKILVNFMYFRCRIGKNPS
jgi:uncharacterized protein (UPF0305 family)